MDYWANKFKEVCKKNGVQMLMMKYYVDDVEYVAEEMSLGVIWNGEEKIMQ